jgi:hypothetical protein
MSCKACGAALPDGARFCAQCATPVPAAQPETDLMREALAKALGTHYRVLRLLGRGGMGAVYLAHEDGLDRDVAIKVLPPERASSPETRERFRREARTAARLTHPNVVPLHTFGEADGMLYYVMGYVRGESLAGRLQRAGRLLEPEARRLLADVAGALDYAHQQGVVHRDIKPDNILLEEGSGRPLLTDFGIAKAVAGGESLTSTGSIIGTPSYMSPEQASGRGEVDARSDLYSLGVMAYAMLSGRLPFEGKTPADVIVQHMTRPAEPLVVQGVSNTLTATVMRCLEKDPARRFARAADLVAALRPPIEDPDALPDELERIEGTGLLVGLFFFYGALVAAYGVYFAARAPAVGVRPFLFGPAPFFLMVLVSLLTAGFMAGGAPRVFVAWRRGFALNEIAHVLFRQPAWWSLWYPRRLRRPSNVWERLPKIVKTVRSIWSAALAVGALALPGVFWSLPFMLEYPRSSRGAVSDYAWGALQLAFLVAAGTIAWARRAVKSDALRRSFQVENFLFRAPLAGSGFWTRPEVAALLTPAPTPTVATAAITNSPTEAPTIER